MHHCACLTAQAIEPLDFSDDRLSHLLKHLSKPAYWHQIEHDLNARSIEVYTLRQEVIRCDATRYRGSTRSHRGVCCSLARVRMIRRDPRSK